MSYYICQGSKKSNNRKRLIMLVTVVLVSSLSTGIFVTMKYSDKIESLNKTIEKYEEKEIYYKDIEQQLFESKADGIVDKRYEEKLSLADADKQKEVTLRDDQISALSDYINELSKQSAALENTIRRQASVSDVKPQNYKLPEVVSRGSYDRLRRTEDTLVTSNMEYVGEWLMTMYAPTRDECGNDKGITRSGLPVQPGQNIAIDPKYWKFGQRFYIEGYGEVVGTDTGNAIKGRNRLDYCVLDPELAKLFGSKRVKVWLIKE